MKNNYRDIFPLGHTLEKQWSPSLQKYIDADELDWDRMTVKDFEHINSNTQDGVTFLQGGTDVSSVGSGTYGRVSKIRHRRTGCVFALKTMRKSTVNDSDMSDHVKMEINVQKQLKHPNIVRCYALLQDSENLYMVLEYCEQGELYRVLRSSPDRRFAEPLAFYYFMQLCNAFYYMHGKGFFHRDIKLENLLLSSTGILKLGDFGWCANVLGPRMNFNFCGTLDYLAPEMVIGGGHDWNVDIWGGGVILYEMLDGKPPFYATRHVDLVTNIVGGKYVSPPWFSELSRGVISSLLKRNPSDRMPLNKLITLTGMEEMYAMVLKLKEDSKADEKGIAVSSEQPMYLPRMSPPRQLVQCQEH
eukprot:GHVO01000614.1.p1 GENE.GHVO01000614.1~~GHVO01000614.1.p1  ORF type:complete len:372 (-),score=57.40 GHVO01000614.1:174-1250(-)